MDKKEGCKNIRNKNKARFNRCLKEINMYEGREEKEKVGKETREEENRPWSQASVHEQ